MSLVRTLFFSWRDSEALTDNYVNVSLHIYYIRRRQESVILFHL